MARAARFSEEAIARAVDLRDKATTATELRQALAVLLVAEVGLDASKASRILGVSQRTLFRHRSRLSDRGGKRGVTWGGRRHFSLSIEQEREFLAAWEAKAIEGGVLSVPPIHAALVNRLGRPIAISTTYRLLARHGWRKVQPDTRHPKTQPLAQEELKKRCPDGGGRLPEEYEELARAPDV